MTCLHCGRELTSPAATHCPWCSEAVAPPAVPAAFLAMLQECRTRPLTLRLLVRKNLKAYGALSLLFFAMGVGFILLGMPTYAVGVAGACLGAISRDFGWFRGVIKTWPYQVAVLDWELIDRLAEGAPVPNSRGARGPAPSN